MPLDTESPAPERSLKRARELEDNAVERVCAVKRHRLLTPSSSDQPLDKTIASPNILSAQPDSHTRLNRFLEKNDTAYEPASKLPILNWLAAVPPHRTESAPARLNSQRTLSNVNGERYQYPSVKPFQETPKSPALDMPQPQGRSIGGTSIASGQGSRHATSSSIYRSILRNNGVFIDHVGEKIPEALRKFVDRDILKTRTPKLSPEAIAATMKKAIMMADSAEGNIYDLVGTAMFSVKRDDVSIGGNTPWSGDALPRSTQYSNSLATPKPDVYIGYTTDMQSTWTIKENAVVDHPAAVPYTRPTRSSCFPFLVFELKSEAAGGTLWQAENQAAGSGSHCVNSMRWFLREAYSLKAPSILDTVAFTIAVTHREAIYYVHFYSEEDDTFYMSCIGNFSTLRSVDIQRSNDVTENILEHGLGTRQQMIRSALEELSPCPERWKVSRPASVLDPQSDSATNLRADGQGSSKS